MKKGEFVKINFEGKVKESGKVFDSGKNIGIVVGAGYVIPGLDDILLQMNVGEKRTVNIEPKKAFGERDQSKVHIVPESEFKKRGTKPTPGMIVDADNKRGRVISVTSGRVKIDFNHPLAGKILTYNIEITEKVENPDEKVRVIVDYFTKMGTKNIKVDLKEKEVEITIPPIIHPVYKKRIADEVIKYLNVEKVKFSEIFERAKPKE